MKIEPVLEEIGLTGSEIKVYMALLSLGTSTKNDIVKKSGISSSKLYEVAFKLADKGMISYFKENNVLHFTASPPSQIIDFLDRKMGKISDQKKKLGSVLPKLAMLGTSSEPDTRIYRGWKGLRTAYNMMLSSIERGDCYFVIGASSGEDSAAVERFFNNIHSDRRRRGITVNMLVSRDNLVWPKRVLNNKKYDKVKFITNTTPSEIVISGKTVMITLLTKIPVVNVINSEFVAKSFKDYFDVLWKNTRN